MRLALQGQLAWQRHELAGGELAQDGDSSSEQPQDELNLAVLHRGGGAWQTLHNACPEGGLGSPQRH